MKHDPLRDGNNALLCLIESRELCLNGIVRVSHNWGILESFVSEIERLNRLLDVRCLLSQDEIDLDGQVGSHKQSWAL